MKKFLLSLALVLGLSTVASAVDVTLPAEGKTWGDYNWTQAGTDFSATIRGCKFEITKGESVTDPRLPAADIRVYGKSSLTLTAPAGITITKVTVNIASGSKATAADVNEGWTASALADNVVTFTASTPQTTISFGGAGLQLRVGSLVFEASADFPEDAPGEVVEPAGDGTEANPYNVTAALAVAKALDESGKVSAYTKGTVKAITEVNTQYGNATYTITDGAATLSVFRGKYFDGEKFTSADQLKVGDEVVVSGDLVNYQGKTPQYTQGSTIISINGQGKPVVAATEVANIAAFMALDVNAKAKFTSPVTVLYQNGNYLYIHDTTGNVLVYGNLGKTYTAGMTIAAGFEGTVDEFNGLKQLVPVVETFAEGAAGTAVEPEVLQIEEIGSDMSYAYVKFVGVTIEGADRNFTMTDESGTLALYQQFTDVEILTGAGKNVTGFVGQHYNKTTSSYDIQVLPISVTNASGREIVATPVFNPGAGKVVAGTEVTITCATEGATIYYTIDGTQPNASSDVYSTPVVVNAAMTLSAIAVKEGMDDSALATAEYTIKEPVVITGNTATFDFTDPSTLDPAYSKADAVADNSNLKIDLPKEGFMFTANGIDLGTVASGNAARLYCQKPDTENEAWSYRIYKNSVTTISCQAGYKIEKVEFTTQTDSYATALGKCQFSENVVYADGVVTPVVEGTDSSVVTSITITNPGEGGATIGFTSITVTFAPASGIADVELDENAPVEFYNLQGVRMQGDLTPGLYIRRQGNTATKVIVK